MVTHCHSIWYSDVFECFCNEFPAFHGRFRCNDVTGQHNEVRLLCLYYIRNHLRHTGFAVGVARSEMDVCELCDLEITVFVETQLLCADSLYGHDG